MPSQTTKAAGSQWSPATSLNRQLTLADGRKLEYTDNGVESSNTLIFHHGTTIGFDVWNAWLKLCLESGVRAVALNRPGVGASTRKPGRRMADDVSDVRELIEHLEVERFVSVGWSGGGGRALGSAFIDGCVGVHTIAGIPSQDPNDPRWMAAVSLERHEKAQINRADFEALLKTRSANFDEEKDVTSAFMLADLEQYLPRFADFKDEYTVFADDFARSIRVALANGPEADADDYAANIHLWGFDIDQINKPVTIWHGDLDEDVEIQYGEYNQSQIPGSKFVRLEGLGHIDIMVEARDAILKGAIDSLQNSENH